MKSIAFYMFFIFLFQNYYLLLQLFRDLYPPTPLKKRSQGVCFAGNNVQKINGKINHKLVNPLRALEENVIELFEATSV